MQLKIALFFAWENENLDKNFPLGHGKSRLGKIFSRTEILDCNRDLHWERKSRLQSRFSLGKKIHTPKGVKFSVSLTVTGERKAAKSRAAVLPSPVRDKRDFL